MPRVFALVLLTAAVLATSSGCRSESRSVGRAPGPEGTAAPVTDLNDVLQLRAAFNRDRGSARLLLVLSPT
jgi:hypothetical protein